MKKPAQQLIAEVRRKRAKVELTIGIGLGDVWSQAHFLVGVIVGRPKMITPHSFETNCSLDNGN